VASDKGVTVAVDTELTPVLVQEGYARDLVRAVNNLRKEAGLDIADRIELTYETSGEVAAAVENFASYIKQETLTVNLRAGAPVDGWQETQLTVGGAEVRLALRKRA
jgi:isoleucyl-tRNA synthetase